MSGSLTGEERPCGPLAPTAWTDDAELSPPSLAGELLPCLTCNRTFLPEALARHQNICQKTAHKKRNVFSSSKQRLQGTGIDPEEVLRSPSPPARRRSASRSSWRDKHTQLLNTVRTARGAAPAAPAPAVPVDYEQCPFCARHFGPKAADRHISWCKEQKSRINTNAVSATAKKQLDARVKYQAPLPLKPRPKRVSGERLSREASPAVSVVSSVVSSPSAAASSLTAARSPTRPTRDYAREYRERASQEREQRIQERKKSPAAVVSSGYGKAPASRLAREGSEPRSASPTKDSFRRTQSFRARPTGTRSTNLKHQRTVSTLSGRSAGSVKQQQPHQLHHQQHQQRDEPDGGEDVHSDRPGYQRSTSTPAENGGGSGHHLHHHTRLSPSRHSQPFSSAPERSPSPPLPPPPEAGEEAYVTRSQLDEYQRISDAVKQPSPTQSESTIEPEPEPEPEYSLSPEPEPGREPWRDLEPEPEPWRDLEPEPGPWRESEPAPVSGRESERCAGAEAGPTPRRGRQLEREPSPASSAGAGRPPSLDADLDASLTSERTSDGEGADTYRVTSGQVRRRLRGARRSGRSLSGQIELTGTALRPSPRRGEHASSPPAPPSHPPPQPKPPQQPKPQQQQKQQPKPAAVAAQHSNSPRKGTAEVAEVAVVGAATGVAVGAKGGAVRRPPARQEPVREVRESRTPEEVFADSLEDLITVTECPVRIKPKPVLCRGARPRVSASTAAAAATGPSASGPPASSCVSLPALPPAPAPAPRPRPRPRRGAARLVLPPLETRSVPSSGRHPPSHPPMHPPLHPPPAPPDTDYDPYEKAERQLEELLGSPSPPARSVTTRLSADRSPSPGRTPLSRPSSAPAPAPAPASARSPSPGRSAFSAFAKIERPHSSLFPLSGDVLKPTALSPRKDPIAEAISILNEYAIQQRSAPDDAPPSPPSSVESSQTVINRYDFISSAIASYRENAESMPPPPEPEPELEQELGKTEQPTNMSPPTNHDSRRLGAVPGRQESAETPPPAEGSTPPPPPPPQQHGWSEPPWRPIDDCGISSNRSSVERNGGGFQQLQFPGMPLGGDEREMSPSDSLYETEMPDFDLIMEQARLASEKKSNALSPRKARRRGLDMREMMGIEVSDLNMKNGGSGGGGGGTTTPRFCHECGSQYPVQAAKFCCQCGAQKLCI